MRALAFCSARKAGSRVRVHALGDRPLLLLRLLKLQRSVQGCVSRTQLGGIFAARDDMLSSLAGLKAALALESAEGSTEPGASFFSNT